jgi:putative FmdB family regulatory protein
MALYEYFCESCQYKFEQISSKLDLDLGKCPKCQGKHTKKLISKFSVGGQGDLRESTLHGCHDCHVSPNEDKPAENS